MKMVSRRAFLKLTAAGGASAYLATRAKFLYGARAAASSQVPLNPKYIPQFTEAVPSLMGDDQLIMYPAGQINLVMTEHMTNVLPVGAVPNYTGTYVWSYLQAGQPTRSSYLGPVIVAKPGDPVEIKFTNNLGTTSSTNVLAYKYSTDQTLHWADPLNNSDNMWNHMAFPPNPGDEGALNYGES
jgi:FtsP/CotA-like multicopper oxidase with cupredoxin domain